MNKYSVAQKENNYTQNNCVKVSVIIPTFNAEPYIQQALESVTHQTELNLEVIVCDDFSTDNTAATVQAMANNDCRIRLLTNNQNQGPSYSRNRAISEAKGKWIAILDADDFYHPERLKKLIAIGELNNADFVADNIFYVDINGKNPITVMSKTTSDDDLKILTATEFIANDFPITTGFKYGFLKPIIRRSFLRKKQVRYDEAVRLGEDFILYVECLMKGAIFVLTNQSYYYYRVVEKSLSRTGDNTKYKELRDNNSKLINIASLAREIQVIKLLKKRQKDYEQLIAYNDITRLVKKRQLYLFIKKLLANPELWLNYLILGNLHIKRLLRK